MFNNTVTNMAGVYIASDLGGDAHTSVYPMVFYGLGNLLSLPLTNSLADRYGSIRLLVYALLGYTLAVLLCASSSTFVLLNIFRFCHGFAAGFFYILTRNITQAFSPEEKKKPLGFIAILIFAIVPVFGVSFGAWLAYESHWHWIFLSNVPLSLFLAAYFWFAYRKYDTPTSPLNLDWIGYGSFALAIGSLVTAATLAQQLDWYRSPTLVTLTLIGIPSLIFFLIWSFAHPTPLLELRLLKNTQLSFSLLSLAVLFSSYFGMIILIALWLNIYANYTPLWIAVLIGIMAIAGTAAYFLSKTFLSDLHPKITLALAILCLALSCYYSTYFDVEVDFFHLAVARSMAGVGLILFLFPVFELCFTSYGPDKSVPIFTLFQVVRVLSSALGAGLYVILWQRRQVFFHERLGEGITLTSPLTAQYYQRAEQWFHLTRERATGELSVLLDKHATSLALNDVFGFMGYILIGLFALLCLFVVLDARKKHATTVQSTEKETSTDTFF